jgi:hypothetical protein
MQQKLRQIEALLGARLSRKPNAAVVINPATESILVEWCNFCGYAGVPWSYEVVRWKVFDLTGNRPSRRWVDRFLRRNPELRARKGFGLDNKRAR